VNKKWAILITVVAMAAVYLFLLAGIPALINMVPPCSNITLEETANTTAVSEVTANWTTSPGFPVRSVDVRTYWEKYQPPWIIYIIPGLVGIYAVVVILKQKKEAK